MTRDAELPARDWVQLVLVGRRRRDRDQRRPVAAGPGADRAELLRRPDLGARTGWTQLADHALASLEAAPAGSDMQLQWSRTFASAARTDEHAEVLRGAARRLAHASRAWPSTPTRGGRCSCGLVAIGAAGDAEIDAEAERDATATGVRRAATARALRPTEESKAETWRLAFHDDDVPNAVHEALLLGFWHPAQRELTAEYVDRYFEDIRPLWDRRPGEIAKNAVQYLFPPVVEPRTIAAADAWLADDRAARAAAPAGVRGPGRHRPGTAGPGVRRGGRHLSRAG